MDKKIREEISKLSTQELYAKCDAYCKKILSYKEILAHILKGCLDEFADYDPKEIEKCIEGEPEISQEPVHRIDAEKIQGMNTEDAAETEGVVKYDILFYATVPSSNETVKLIINVEAQGNFYPGYPLPKRAVYYCSRLISAQHNTEFTEKTYGDIKKVVSIWVCINPPLNKKNTITSFSLNEKYRVGKAQYNPKDYDLMEIVMIGLANGDSYKNTQGVIKLLTAMISPDIRSDTEERLKVMEECNISRSIYESEVSDVCSYSQGVFEMGMERGVEKGAERSKLNDIRNIMESLSLTLEQALKALKVPTEEYDKYKMLLKETI